MSGLLIDNFAGGGGASTGIEQALGRAVDIAINHDEQAIRMHEVNHPGTRHIRNNIWQVDPIAVTEGKPVGLAWFSPDCKHFSKAKGGRPREKSIRDLAWVVVLWAQRVRPALILLENVEEFRTWGPLDHDGQPIKARAGETFAKWCRELRRARYKLQFRELRACDYGAPTIRKRFFMIARCDGLPIVWPEPTHGKPDSPEVLAGNRLPWRTAAEIIDWSIACPSIFERKKPLAEKTLRRIAHGIVKFVLDNPRPFIITTDFKNTRASRVFDPDEPLRTQTSQPSAAVVVPHVTKFRNGAIGHGVDEPLATVTANSFIKRPGGCAPLGVVEATCAPFVSHAQQGGRSRSAEDPLHTITSSDGDHNTVIAAHLINTRNGEREGQAPRALSVEKPFTTVTAKGSQGAVVSAFLAQFSETREGRKLNAGHSMEEPVSTIVQKGPLQAVCTSNLVKLRGTCQHGQPVDEPLATVSAQGTHIAEVRAFLLKYYGNETEGHDPTKPLGTVTTKERFGLVTVTIDGEDYVIVDIGMRMLTPRELFNAQGFPFWSRQFRINIWHDLDSSEVADLASARGKSAHAKSAAGSSSSSSTADQIGPADVRALIDLGRQVLQLSSPGKSGNHAPSAVASVCVPLPIEIASAAQMLAPSSCAARPASALSVSPNASSFTRARHGGTSAASSGGATTRDADVVERATVTEAGGTKCTTSPGGPSSRASASSLRTLSCFVADAIALSTLARTSTEHSSVELEVRHHYIIDHDVQGAPITKTAQVAKCGNSVCPPLARALVMANASREAAKPESQAA
jgi:DNA (cytosine-5)-methyltransferase 1